MDWLDEVAQELLPPMLEEGEFTVKMLLERYSAKRRSNISHRALSLRLESRTLAGEFTRRKVLIDGRYSWAYKKADK